MTARYQIPFATLALRRCGNRDGMRSVHQQVVYGGDPEGCRGSAFGNRNARWHTRLTCIAAGQADLEIFISRRIARYRAQRGFGACRFAKSAGRNGQRERWRLVVGDRYGLTGRVEAGGAGLNRNIEIAESQAIIYGRKRK